MATELFALESRNVYMRRLPNHFIKISGLVLAITGLAKLSSSLGNALILQNPDPILHITFRQVFWVVGVIELAIGVSCLFSKRIWLPAVLIAWLATIFGAYRFGFVLIGWHKPCSCLGNLTDLLHISPQTADFAMKIILAYLLIGSYATLFWLWRQNRMTPNNTQAKS